MSKLAIKRHYIYDSPNVTVGAISLLKECK